jgi:hypothetical protein
MLYEMRIYDAVPRDGPLVAKVTNYILKPTPYSPMQ